VGLPEKITGVDQLGSVIEFIVVDKDRAEYTFLGF